MIDHCSRSLEQAWRVACKWKTPPQWRTGEWREELKCVANWILLEAEMNYVPARNGERDRYLFLRVLSALQTHHRREWRFGMRNYLRIFSNDPVAEATSFVSEFEDPQLASEIETTELRITLHQSLDLLNHDDRLLPYSIYFDERTEDELALRAGVSQAAINQRKQRALNKLRILLSDGGG